MFPILMNHLRVTERSRATLRPGRVRGDKTYSSRAIRQHLRSRGINAAASEGGRPVGHDVED